MKVIVTYKQDITAKAGQKYVIYRGISESGDMVEAFLTASQAEEFAIPDSVIASKAQVAELFRDMPAVDVEFNQRGRIDSIKV